MAETEIKKINGKTIADVTARAAAETLGKAKAGLPVDVDGNPDHGTAGQYAQSDGAGGLKWGGAPAGGVSSVNGKTGAVSLGAADVGARPATWTPTASEVGALPADTKIPANTSDLTNDAGFITKTVADLVNYYTKSQTYTQAEINALVSAIPKFAISVVSALPTSGISGTTVYLVGGGSDADLYTEYIYVNGAWEILGSQRVDLTGYATETWVNAKLADYLTAETLTAAIITGALGYTPAKADDMPDVDDTLTTAGAAADAAKVGEELSTLSEAIADKVSKTGITLEQHTDGLIYIFVDGAPVGNGVELGTIVEGDIIGTFEENNNILLSGDIADGSYTLAFIDADGNTIGTGSLEVSAVVNYTVTQNLTEVTSDNTATSIMAGTNFTTNISVNDGYELSSIVVTMGGTDISATAVNGTTISIANVTGDIVITAVATEIVVPTYTNILTSGTYEIQLNKRWSGSGKSFTGCDGMIGFKVPMTDVVNKTIRFKGFTANGTSSSQPPLWMSVKEDGTRVGALGGTTSGAGNIWTSTHLVDEGDGVYSIAINESTMASVSTAPYLVIVMNVYTSEAITTLPDYLIMTIDEEIV